MPCSGFMSVGGRGAKKNPGWDFSADGFAVRRPVRKSAQAWLPAFSSTDIFSSDVPFTELWLYGFRKENRTFFH